MLPLSLDVARLRLVLIGTGAAAARRLEWLEQAGATSVVVFSAAPSRELALAAGSRLERRWPDAADFAGAQLVFIADLHEPQRNELAAAARAAGAIVHVEDAPALCDVQAPAILRRGDLTIAISTNGAAPGLAAELKQFVGEIFGAEWQGRVGELKVLRRRWHGAGATPEAIRRLTASHVARRFWLGKCRGEAANDSAKAINERGGGS